MARKADEKIMKPFLRELVAERHTVSRLIRMADGWAGDSDLLRLERLQSRLDDKITVLQRHYCPRIA